MELREYQTEAVAAIRAAFRGHRKVLFVLPTGGGKTVVFSYITTNAAAKGKRVLVLAHRTEITDQISAALAGMGVAHGRVQPDHAMTDDLVQVGMVQTAARRLDRMDAPDLIVIDEAHHAIAGTWGRVLMQWPGAKVLGVTATPERLDGRGLIDAFDVMVTGPDVRDLIDARHLARFRYYAPDTKIDLSGVRTLGGDYVAADLERAMAADAIVGDVIAHYHRYMAGRSAIVFCVSVSYARRVAEQFAAAGVPAASIDGEMRSEARRSVVEQLRDGSIRILTSCEIVSEGFDVPAVGGAILLRPTQSFALYRQQVGRCLRPKPDGSAAIILDHVGNVTRHALPDAEHAWSLDSRPRTPRDQMDGAQARVCGTCRAVFPPDATAADCPEPSEPGCLFAGNSREVGEQPGELHEVTSDWTGGISIRHARGPAWVSLLERAGADRARLRQIQIARQYKPGWVFHRVRDALTREAASQIGHS